MKSLPGEWFRDRWYQALDWLLDHGEVTAALGVVCFCWTVGTVFVAFVLGAVGPWPWWSALVAFVVACCYGTGVVLFLEREKERNEELRDRVEEVDAAATRTLRTLNEALESSASPVSHMADVMGYVGAERARQRRAHGDDDHADVAAPECGVDTLADEGREGEALRLAQIARAHGIAEAWRAKLLCEVAFREGRGTWGHLLVEEVAEAIEAAATQLPFDGDRALEAELVQVAAVAIAWAEHLRRRRDAARRAKATGVSA